MKYSARIATLSALLAVICTGQAQAARGVRTDNNPGNGWSSCATYDCSWLEGILFNPIGLTPLLPSSFEGPEWELAGGGNTTVDVGANEFQQGFFADAPGLSISGNGAQVMYFGLGAAPDAQLYKIIDPNGVVLFDPDSNADLATDAWQVEFNYGLLPADGASFLWGNSLYTASTSILQDSTNVFVYYNGVLNAPIDWQMTSIPVISVPEPNTFGLFLAALALFVTIGLRRKGAESPLRA